MRYWSLVYIGPLIVSPVIQLISQLLAMVDGDQSLYCQ